MRHGYVYIMTNKPFGTLYIGVTSDLIKRMYIHKKGLNKRSFTYKYKLTQLVFYEEFASIGKAIDCEKRLKRWKRTRKIKLIVKQNP